jgi:two-component system, cell cycle response regulator
MANGALCVCFVGLPNEFQWAHKAEVEGVSEKCLWIERAEFIPASVAPSVIVLNLDEPSNNEPALWETLQRKFPQADRIALSSNDSAVLAMRCLRSGFADFLTQPVSPEELVLCLLRSKLLKDSTAWRFTTSPTLAQSLNFLSSASSSETLRVRTTEVLKTLLSATEVLWELAVVTPKSPTRKTTVAKGQIAPLAFPCGQELNGKILASGFTSAPSKEKIEEASILVKHAELVLMNVQQVERLKQQTFIDDLTGLYNSRYLRFSLESAALAYDQKKQPFSVLFIDVDRFKSVNDENGHLVGSEFLSALGKIVKNAVRKGDSVFRYGGDEFVVLLRRTKLSNALEIAERLRKSIEKRTFVIRGTELSATISIGLASFPDHAKKVDRLIQLADEAMYRSKRTRNQVSVADPQHPKARPPRRPQPSL